VTSRLPAPSVTPRRSPRSVSATVRARAPLSRFLLGSAGVLAVFSVWEVASRVGLVNAVYLPPPSRVVVRIPDLLRYGPLVPDVVTSLTAIAVGVLVGHLVGLSLATAAFRLPWFRMVVSPVIELTRGIAPLALLPAFLLLFGLGIKSAIAIIAWTAWVPIFLNTLEGLDAVNPAHIRSAAATGASQLKILISVYVPSILGHYLTGLRLAVGAGWLAVVAAEMLGANAGLGFRIFEFSVVFRIADMYATIMVIGILGLLTNVLIMGAQHRALRWRTS
jgi:NitT/TauT family transport system permease protein